MRTVLAAVLLAAAFAVPAQAQPMDANRIVASIGGFDFHRAVDRLSTAPSVHVIRLSTLAGADAVAERLWNAEQIKGRDLARLRSNIRQNFFAMTAVRGAGVSVDQIFAVDMPSDNAAILYADDL